MTDRDGRGVTEWPARKRWTALAVSLAVAAVCLTSTVALVVSRGAGESPGERVSSLAKDEVPQSDEAEEREELLSAARTFVLRFNTYGPDMLDNADHLPEYASTVDLMTPTFATVFDDNVGYAEQTVLQLGASRSAEVYAVGVASQDPDSAEVLVAGTVELSYPYPDEADRQTSDDEQQGDSEDDPQIVSTGPQRFRYEVSLVKVEGEWLVDNLDDIDDGLPPFADPLPEGQGQPTLPSPSQAPTQQPSTGAPSPQGGQR